MANRKDIKLIKDVYRSMISRCYEPLTPNYHRYGGRGIYVSDEWAIQNNGIDAFILWSLNNGYEQGLTLDRINNNGPYAPWNCRWATMKEQGNNRRSNTYINHCGEVNTLTEWADIIDQPTLPASKISGRIRRGWPYEAALFLGDYQDPDEFPVYDIYGNKLELPSGRWLDKHQAYIERIKLQRKNGLGHVNENEFFGFDENGHYRSESLLPLMDGDLRNADHKSTYTYRRAKKPKADVAKKGPSKDEIVEKELLAIWLSIIARCYDDRSSKYRQYGAKGIRVSDFWVSDFNNFLKWAMPIYFEGCRITRIDKKGDYTPYNCEFVPKSSIEKTVVTNALKVKYKGQIMRFADLVRDVGTVDYATAKYRLERNYGTAYAIFAKPGDKPGCQLRNRDGFMVLNYAPGTDSSSLTKDFYVAMMRNKNR